MLSTISFIYVSAIHRLKIYTQIQRKLWLSVQLAATMSWKTQVQVLPAVTSCQVSVIAELLKTAYMLYWWPPINLDSSETLKEDQVEFWGHLPALLTGWGQPTCSIMKTCHCYGLNIDKEYTQLDKLFEWSPKVALFNNLIICYTGRYQQVKGTASYKSSRYCLQWLMLFCQIKLVLLYLFNFSHLKCHQGM